ncbi:hypothetical protein SAMN02910344_01527 [Ruminobacter amylophilus]|uniref:Uncharacterized protein n=1 Tax=Ruminobacter amylophilus TaxID=867 RepID=A0A662ZI21_9GAMM|nr:hypothetical protein SAMN02910344_01527 [Ruminobacter amylophilus]
MSPRCVGDFFVLFKHGASDFFMLQANRTKQSVKFIHDVRRGFYPIIEKFIIS